MHRNRQNKYCGIIGREYNRFEKEYDQETISILVKTEFGYHVTKQDVETKIMYKTSVCVTQHNQKTSSRNVVHVSLEKCIEIQIVTATNVVNQLRTI